MIVPFLPATNLFVYVGFVVAERILYLPSAGYCLLVSIGFESLVHRLQHYRTWFHVCFGFMIVVFAVRTVTRTFDWLDEESLYSSAVSINPPKALGNLANVLSAQGRQTEAEQAYRAALSYRPNMADVHYNLALLLQEQDKLAEAVESYRRAISYRPRLAVAYLNLGIVLVKLGRLEEAKKVFTRCAELDGDGVKNIRLHETTRVSALYNLGRVYADQGDHERAIELYRQAVARAPAHYRAHSLYNMLGDALFRLNRTEEAEQWFRRSMNEAKGSSHVPTLLSYGQMLAKANRTLEARRLYRKAVELFSNDSSAHQHYGQFLSSRGELKQALEHYRLAYQLLSPSTSESVKFDVVLNLANTLRELKKNDEAELYYEKAVKLQPENVLGHSNLGAIYHLNGKYDKAEKSYHDALKLRADDAITLANLSKLRQAMLTRKA